MNCWISDKGILTDYLFTKPPNIRPNIRPVKTESQYRWQKNATKNLTLFRDEYKLCREK